MMNINAVPNRREPLTHVPACAHMPRLYPNIVGSGSLRPDLRLDESLLSGSCIIGNLLRALWRGHPALTSTGKSTMTEVLGLYPLLVVSGTFRVDTAELSIQRIIASESRGEPRW
jgi:hypothetical protein